MLFFSDNQNLTKKNTIIKQFQLETKPVIWIELNSDFDC